MLEVVVNHARFVGEACQGAVVTHGAQWIASLGHQGQQHELHGLYGVTKCLHALYERFRVIVQFCIVRCQVGQLQLLLCQPLPIGTFFGELLLEFFVGDQATLEEVHQEHLAWLQSSLQLDVRRVYWQHAHLRGHNDLVVVCYVVTRGTQSIAVQYRADVVAVGEGDRRWTVPRLHQRRVIFVEISFRLRHVLVLLPCLGDHHHDGLLQRPAGHEQEFQHVVEGA